MNPGTDADPKRQHCAKVKLVLFNHTVMFLALRRGQLHLLPGRLCNGIKLKDVNYFIKHNTRNSNSHHT